MDTNSFFIRYCYHDQWADAKIRPSLHNGDSAVHYAVWIKGKLSFIITKQADGSHSPHWQNLSTHGDLPDSNELIQLIGAQIESHLINS